MEQLRALPEPARAGVIAAPLAAASAFFMGDNESILSYALGYGVLTAAATYAAPMATLDPMLQIAVVGGAGIGAQMLAPEYVPGSALMAGGLPAASLYVARQFA